MNANDMTDHAVCDMNETVTGAPSGAPAKEAEMHTIHVGVSARVFRGLAKQNMTGHQCVMELVDNALAASEHREKALVQVALAGIPEEPDMVRLAVADWGSGMDLSHLENALQLGSAPMASSRLNEHGLGFNNAVSGLTGGRNRWTVYTRTDNTAPYLKVSGPFDLTMTAEETNTLSLPEGIALKWDEPSTVVLTEVSLEMLQTLRRGGGRCRDLATLRSWLIEHLGVTYRGYLSPQESTMEPKTKIAVSVGNDCVLVPAIEVPYLVSETKRFELELAGRVTPVVYRYGFLNEDARSHALYGGKLKYYYQRNPATQGIDIRIGDRVLCTSQLERIWTADADGETALARHPSFNAFVGEVILPELPRGVMSTLNNKTDVNLSDTEWGKLFRKLNEFKPLKLEMSRTEKALQKQWMEMLSSTCPNDRVSDEYHVWPTGTRIDVVQESGTDRIVYELKAGKAGPLDLYQLRMYWDGLVVEGVQPTEGVLIAKEYSSDIQRMAELMNKMPPPLFPDGTQSRPYRFSAATHKEKGLGRDTGVIELRYPEAAD